MDEEDLPPHATFEAWVIAVFDHADSEGNYLEIEIDRPEPEPERSLEYLTRLFENCDVHLATYSDQQISTGLNYLLYPGASRYGYRMFDLSLPWSLRSKGFDTILCLYDKLFADRCTPILSDIDEPGGLPLNSNCYMLWDTLCGSIRDRHSPLEVRQQDYKIMEVMAHGLFMDNIACQESALHGLGHWHRAYPKETEKWIERFRNHHRNIRPELADYAAHAMIGYVQ
ncbi:hypothetical protein BH11PLA2_BH11PLA2_46580 [soil metagenome]